jgi:Undecaprenyl-phosphate glucose phosphotransferase
MLALVVAAGVAGSLAPGEGPIPLAFALLLALLLTPALFDLLELYRYERLFELDFTVVRAAVGWTLVAMALVSVGYAGEMLQAVPRMQAALFYAGGLFGLTGARLLAALLVAHWQKTGRLVRHVVIVGAGELGQRLVRHLQQAGQGVRLIGLFDDRRDRIPEYVAGYPVLGTVDDLIAFARSHPVDLVIVALPYGAQLRIREWLQKLRALPADVRLCPDIADYHLGERGVSHIAGVPMVHIYDRPLAGWNAILKACEDRLLAGFVLLLTAPLLAVIAVLVRLDSPGPIFYRQKRWGFAGQPIEILKFRTMYAELCDDGESGPVRQAHRGDPRITRIGRWLRRYSLDELPQFLNVLKGDMSIVGPRPHAVAHNELYARLIGDYLARHRVKPGITGWAQVNGLRGETPTVEHMHRRVQYDLYYVENWSLLFDLKIILRTLLVGFRDPDA